ncbi:hypothetical protein Tco_0022284 [Tanacetum coccineum]
MLLFISSGLAFIRLDSHRREEMELKNERNVDDDLEIYDVDGAPPPRYPMSGDITVHQEIELSYMYVGGMDQVEEPNLLEVTLCSTDAIENQN